MNAEMERRYEADLQRQIFRIQQEVGDRISEAKEISEVLRIIFVHCMTSHGMEFFETLKLMKIILEDAETTSLREIAIANKKNLVR